MQSTRVARDDRPSLAAANRLLLVCGALSLAAIAFGAWVCAANGVPATLWLRNLAAWLIGVLAAYALARWSGHRLFPTALIAAVVLLAATLVSPGQLGVHRWIALGPLSVNAAMLMLPAGLVALAALIRSSPWWWLTGLAGLALLVAQPDASQATAFAAAFVWIALKSPGRTPLRLAVSAAAVLLAAAAWLRPDPLQPVPEVEQILELAYILSPALAGVALAALILFSLAPALLARGHPPDVHLSGAALSLYFLASAAMPFVGAFPVPLVGLGVSPVLGAWLGLGALAALPRGRV